jgi:predicted DNA-binding protein with PD1-like motif
MNIKQSSDCVIIRLVRGEELITSLKVFAKTHSVSGGFFHGLGGADSARLAIYRYDTDDEYHDKQFAGPLEITSLNGNIALDESGEVMIHCHANIAGPDMVVSGGHVQEMIIGGTCEIILDTRTGDLQRQHDSEIGLKLLKLHDE